MSLSRKKKNHATGFSLIELSVVLLVIGILVIGVSQGYNLVRGAQLSNARGITTKSPVGQTEGLTAWYEASLKESVNQNQMFDGAQITQWKDISANSFLNGNNILTSAVSNNITFAQSAINKIPGIKFVASTSKLNLASFNQGGASQATIFIVVKLNYVPDTSNYKTIFDNGSASTYSISIKADAVQINNGTSATTASTANSFALGKECIIAVYFNGTNSQVFLNNTNSKLGGSGLSITGTNQLNGLTVGNNFAGTQGFSGFIPEVIVFNRVLKESERKEIFYYLSKKYKIDVIGT